MLTGYVCWAAGSDLGATKGLTTPVRPIGVQVALLVSSGLGLIPSVWGVVCTVISPLCGTVQLAPLPLTRSTSAPRPAKLVFMVMLPVGSNQPCLTVLLSLACCCFVLEGFLCVGAIVLAGSSGSADGLTLAWTGHR